MTGRWLAAFALLALAGCGGGGGSGGETPPATTTPANRAPVAVDDAFRGDFNTVVSGNVLANDRDPDGNALTITGNTEPDNGTVTLTSTGALSYISRGGFVGEDRFTYTVSDGRGGSATATVAITIAPPGATRSVAGRVGILAESVIDLDTNNPDNTRGDNNTLATAQFAPNPATIGGYVNRAGTGASGATQALGDLDDFYRIEAVAGQRISLVIAESNFGDVDLYLYNTSGEIEAFSRGTSDLEEVIVPRTGTWFINANLYVSPGGIGGASNYAITLGSGVTTATNEVIPGELIVELADERVLQPGAAADRAQQFARRLGGEWRGGDTGRARRLRTRSNILGSVDNRYLADKLNALSHSVELTRQWQTWELAKQVSAAPEVSQVEVNHRRRASLETNDRFARLQWDHRLINLPAAWDFTTGDPGVIVAVIDSGIVLEHPDLAGQLVDGFDFVSNASISGDGDGIDPDPSDDGAGTTEDIGSYSYHGTHVAGIVSAAGNNEIGIAGVAYGARTMPIRALGGSSGSSFDVLQAILYAAGLENDSGTVPERRADIINLSLGGNNSSNFERNTINEVIASGVVVVAAAGNEGAGRLSFPAGYDAVIAVGATDLEGVLTDYSNTGNGLDLVAPGGDSGSDRNGDGYADAILSTGLTERGPAYTFLSGTSMAAPVVSGVFALMQSVNPELGPDSLLALLEQGELTNDRGATGYDTRYGWGLIDAQKAVFAALESIGQTPTRPAQLTVSTEFVNAGAALTGFELILDNRGTEVLSIDSVGSSATWLSATPAEVDANGLGTWRVGVDRSGLAEGQYRASLLFSSPANSVTVEVKMRVSSDVQGRAGTIYILFYDPETERVIAQAETTLANEYDFTDIIPAGQYEIWAGTDNDNDQLVCDAGETCGAYQTIDAPVLVDFNQDLTGLNFPSGYQIQLQGVGTSSTDQSPRRRPELRRIR